MNTFLNSLIDGTNYTYTENGALTHKTTKSYLYDMFAMGGAMRNRSDEDVLNMFWKAFNEDPEYALKCLFYLRDIRGGQGERRFFRVVLKSLAINKPKTATAIMRLIPEYGRWDDLYTYVGTPLEKNMFAFLKEVFTLDLESKTPSLLGKWLKSENTSSVESKRLANRTRQAFGLSHRLYRKALSLLRTRINVLEKLMSANEWDKIEFDKIPSKAGMIYRNAFARHDFERAQKGARTYRSFAEDENTAVNAKALYPYECVSKVMCGWGIKDLSNTERKMIDKYWENLEDYFHGCSFNGLTVVDTSGSMYANKASAPINVAISMGLYCADKATGPFKNHFLTFSHRPELQVVSGEDFYAKVCNMSRANWDSNTDIKAVFDLLLTTAKRQNCKKEDIPQNIIIVSDMEFDSAVATSPYYFESYSSFRERTDKFVPYSDTLMEDIAKEWKEAGYEMPHLVFWNVDARQDNIPMIDTPNVSYVSGMSPVIFEMVMKGKTGYDLMIEKLNSQRYVPIHYVK